MRLNKQVQNKHFDTKTKLWEPRFLYNFFFLILVIILSVCAVNWSSIKDSILFQVANIGFRLQILEVNGRNHTTHEELIDALKLQNNEPILSINLSEKRKNVEQLGWVEKAYLERILPDTLRLSIIERKPIALLQTQNGHQLIDQKGEAILGAAPETFGHLPVVSGEDAAIGANHLIETLKTEPELYAEIWAVHYISTRRWNVLMKNGVTIKLPEYEPGYAWSKLARLDYKNQIIHRDLAVIDMRLQDQILIEPNLPIRGKGQET